MTARRFSSDDQAWFVGSTGDASPRHVDADFAAARFPGRQVVHGLHVLLWALDVWAAAAPPGRLARVEATFLKPVFLDEELQADVDDDASLVRVTLGGESVTVVRAHLGDGTSGAAFVGGDPRAVPAALHGDAIDGAAGEVPLPDRAATLHTAFVHLAGRTGPTALAGLAGLSTLVGMHCPGATGILAKLDVALVGSAREGPLTYRVRRFVPAFSHAVMDVGGLGLEGQVSAFVERSYVPPSDDRIRGLVRDGEFAGTSPLVVGASGGIGAVTARLLAAGGASPVLTWHRSEEGLKEVAASLEAFGTVPRSVRLDVRDPADGLAALHAIGWEGAQVCYLATPRIFRRYLRSYRPDALREFLEVYVDGFERLIEGLVAASPERRLRVLHPSSVAIDEVTEDLLEYSQAKLASEQLCRWLEARHPAVTCATPRLPRLETPQTLAFRAAPAAATEEVMIEVLREAFLGPSET
jgi:NAD(P)-dependent dehydrogenase (short-subunit alcohol dehydrogenase family)